MPLTMRPVFAQDPQPTKPKLALPDNPAPAAPIPALPGPDQLGPATPNSLTVPSPALPEAVGSGESTVTINAAGSALPATGASSEQEPQVALPGETPLTGPTETPKAEITSAPLTELTGSAIGITTNTAPVRGIAPPVIRGVNSYSPLANAALPRPPEVPSTLFRIGFLRPAEESALDRQWYQNLRRALLEDKAVSQALRETGFIDIALRPCEGPEDMIQRMDQMEFELVFCPTLVYVLQRTVRPKEYPYRVFLQTRRNYLDSHGGEHVRQRGVLFARRDSALDHSGKVSPPELKKALGKGVLAVSGRYDAAGYFDIRKMLWDAYNHTTPADILFCGSPQEVVKSVVAGLCDMGACEESVLNEVFSTVPDSPGVETDIRDGRNSFIRIIDASRGVPSDPVTIRDKFEPLSTGSPLGLAVADALKRFYRNPERGAPVLENSNDSVYDAVVEDTKRLQGSVW